MGPLESKVEAIARTIGSRVVHKTGYQGFIDDGFGGVFYGNAYYDWANGEIGTYYDEDWNDAQRAAVLAHEVGHGLNHLSAGGGKRPENWAWKRSRPNLYIEERNATYRAYEMLWALTDGNVPEDAAFMLNISIAARQELLPLAQQMERTWIGDLVPSTITETKVRRLLGRE